MNDFIFKGLEPSLYRTRAVFKEKLALLLHRGTQKAYFGLLAYMQKKSEVH
jgi:hypothetical protein